MKFECKGCVEPCLLDVGSFSANFPEVCPIGCKKVCWHEVTEPAALPSWCAPGDRYVDSSGQRGTIISISVAGIVIIKNDGCDKTADCPDQYFLSNMKPESAALPKLTVEALAERGIEWPEWATCAVVDQSGLAFWFNANPKKSAANGFWYGGKCELIPGKWDASDWQNSKIMRPAKVEKPQLPDWLKVGAWAAVWKFVGKIDWISRDGSECRITCGESRFAKRDEVKAVTWRAWTRSEWCEQIGKRFKFSDGERMLLGVSEHEAGFMIEFIDRGGAPDEVISEWEITQLNGLPCGVTQVDGKDLEG